MALAFFISSTGDTYLVNATVKQLLANSNYSEKIYIISVTQTAELQSKSLRDLNHPNLIFANIKEVAGANAFPINTVNAYDLAQINQFIADNKIDRVVVTVPSPIQEEIPYQIAKSISVPCDVLYEFMHKAEAHPLWNHVKDISLRPNCFFVVPVAIAADVITAYDKDAKIDIIGHISIDAASQQNPKDKKTIRDELAVSDDKELVILSSCTQPKELDIVFLTAILTEFSTNKYLQFQLRYSLHPGMADADVYLQTVLDRCKTFPDIHEHFKIILTPRFLTKLQKPIAAEDEIYFLRKDVNGDDATHASDYISQAVPGALVVQSALMGKVTYCHSNEPRYIPSEWFAANAASFFAGTRKGPHSRNELGLTDAPAPVVLANLLQKSR